MKYGPFTLKFTVLMNEPNYCHPTGLMVRVTCERTPPQPLQIATSIIECIHININKFTIKLNLQNWWLRKYIPCTPSPQQKTCHPLSLLQDKMQIISLQMHKLQAIPVLPIQQNNIVLVQWGAGGWGPWKYSPLRFTPRCFSKASSMSRDPRIIQGVVPQTKRWYLPTWRTWTS